MFRSLVCRYGYTNQSDDHCPGNEPAPQCHMDGKLTRMDDRYYCGGKAGLTVFVMKHHYTHKAGTRKKRPASRVFFFLPAFGRCCPSVSVHPANSIRCSSNIAIADHFPSKTFSFKHHLTGEAWPACRAILPFHSNTT